MLYDISMAIHPGMSVYKNKAEKKPELTVRQDFSQSSTYESSLHMDLHTGTHIDAPLHMLQGGARIESIPLARLLTPCKVFDLTHAKDKITAADLRGIGITPGDFVLLKTRNSWAEEFDPEFVYLDQSGAAFLAAQKISGVGIDALGIERAQPEHETHKLLFQAEIIILEGLRLKEVPEGRYMLYALPLKLQGVEAAPVRAVLMPSNSGRHLESQGVSHSSQKNTPRIPPRTTNITLRRKKARTEAVTPPARAEVVVLVEERIPGTIRALRAAKGMNCKKRLRKGGKFTFPSRTMGSIRGI